MGYKKQRLLINNWAVALIVIGQEKNPPSIVGLGKIIDCTYSSLAGTTHELERRGLINRTKQGRRITLELTAKGRKIYEALNTIIETTNIENYAGVNITTWGLKNAKQP